MRLPSESTQLLMRRLDEMSRTGKWSVRSKKTEEICSLLSDLAASKDPAGTPAAIPFLFSRRLPERIAARRAVSSLMSCIAPPDLLHLHDLVGWSYAWYGPEAWSNLAPADVAALAGTGEESTCVAVLGLASLHRNGYVRHEAVRLLSQIFDGSELTFLLIRQNDWVQPIASDAQAAVAARINLAYLPHLVAPLPLILHLKSFGRNDLAGVARRILEILLHPDHEPTLQSVLGSASRQVRREVVSIGFELQPRNRILFFFGFRSDDPILRLSACRHVLHLDDPYEARLIIEELKRDSCMSVRREALRLQAAQFPDAAADIWKAALCDTSLPIRELARVCLLQLDPAADVPSIYRATVAQRKDFLPAIAGLAETGDASDADFFRQLLSHSWPSRRRIALKGLNQSLEESAIPEICAGLRDRSPAVVREAEKILAPRVRETGGERLLAVVLHAPEQFSRRAGIDLIVAMGKWISLPWLIRAAAAANDDETREYARQMMECWFAPPICNRIFTIPSKEDRMAIQSALDSAVDRLPTKLVSMIRTAIATTASNF